MRKETKILNKTLDRESLSSQFHSYSLWAAEDGIPVSHGKLVPVYPPLWPFASQIQTPSL